MAITSLTNSPGSQSESGSSLAMSPFMGSQGYGELSTNGSRPEGSGLDHLPLTPATSSNQKVVCDCVSCISLGKTKKVSKSTRSRHRKRFNQSPSGNSNALNPHPNAYNNRSNSISSLNSKFQFSHIKGPGFSDNDSCENSPQLGASIPVSVPSGYHIDTTTSKYVPPPIESGLPLRPMPNMDREDVVSMQTDSDSASEDAVETVTIAFFRNILSVIGNDICS